MRIAIVNVATHTISSEHGMGYQLPLWAVSIGGPLVDAGHEVELIDADVRHLSHIELCHILRTSGADIVMLGHPGSTHAYLKVAETARAIKTQLPKIQIAYGGVFPTYAHRTIMRQESSIDFIVKGEGEATALDLAQHLSANENDLSTVDGLVWRKGTDPVVNTDRSLIQNLDDYRFGWGLVDWEQYNMIGMGRAAVNQFSRGCTYHCGYCGQAEFWKKYRHRDPSKFVDDLSLLRSRYGVEHVAPADEHFFAHRGTSEEMIEQLISKSPGVNLYVNTTVRDVLRDRDLVTKYPDAGITFVTLGVETDSAEVGRTIGKRTPLDESIEAVSLLRDMGIVTSINMIYGLEDENLRTTYRKLKSLIKIDSDFNNLVYLTPHFWTKTGSQVKPADVVQQDLSKWNYREQVLSVPNMSPRRLFWSVKATEAIVHTRPKFIIRALSLSASPTARSFRQKGWKKAAAVWFREVAEFELRTTHLHGADQPRSPQVHELALGGVRPIDQTPEAPLLAESGTAKCPVVRAVKRMIA